MDEIKYKCKSELCNNEIVFSPKKRNKQFCSDKCAREYYEFKKTRWNRKKKVYVLICENCKNSFEWNTNKVKYCSRKCRNHYFWEKNKDILKKSLKPLVEMKCNYSKCENMIMTKGGRAKYCCSRCSQRAKYFKERRNPTTANRHYIRTKTGQFASLFFAYKNNKCELCDASERLLIHHKRYTLDYRDWILVCQKCHKKMQNDNIETEKTI